MTKVSNYFEHDLLDKIIPLWKKQEQKAYLVGGAVRDGLLQRLNFASDLDLLVPQNALNVSRKLADALDAAYYPVDPIRGVGRVVFADGRHLDVANFRAPTLDGDLLDRDFTINAIALDLNDFSLIDPLNGQADLRARRVRVVTDKSIQNDPIRALRGVRMAMALNFEIDDETQKLITANVSGLKQISPERLRDEILKLLAIPHPGTATETLRKFGLLSEILPEVLPMVGVEQSPPHHLSVWEHTLLAMDTWANFGNLDATPFSALTKFLPDLRAYFRQNLAGNISRETLMIWIALLHDAGKAETKSVEADGRIRFFGHERVSSEIASALFSRLHFSDAARKFVTETVRHHMRPMLLAQQKSVSERAIHRFLIATGDTAPAVAIFSLIDHLAIFEKEQGDERWNSLLGVVQRLLAGYFSPKPKPLLTGAEVISILNIDPGPKVGAILRRLAEAQAVGEISTKEEARAFLK